MRWQVCDGQTGQPVAQSGWIDNLILNNGLDQVATRSWCDCFTYCVAGGGTTASSISSGAITATQVGANVTASGPIFTSAQVGDMIAWDGGEERRITAFTDDQHVTVTPASPNASTDTFVIWNTSRNNLDAETHRSNTYQTGSPNCESSRTGSILHHRRTYDFPVEVGNVTYGEIGFSWAASGLSTIFSRIVPPAIPVLVGQFLRVVYELAITLSPTLPNHIDPAVGGWPVLPAVTKDGDEMLQYCGMSSIASTGATTTFDVGLTTNEPSSSGSACLVFLSTSSAALSIFPGEVDRSAGGQAAVNTLLTPYTSLSFVQDKEATFSVGQANNNGLRSLGTSVGTLGNEYRRIGWAVLFDEAQTKPNTHLLTFTIRYSWGRTLA